MTAGMLDELSRVGSDLRAAGARLRTRPVAEVAGALGAVGERFLDPADPLRTEALDRLPPEAGVSPAMAERVLDGMALDWTTPRLGSLLRAEFGDPSVLDRFVSAAQVGVSPGSGWPDPTRSPRRVRAMGDGLAIHVGAGSVPGVGTTSVIRSLLVKTPVLLKPGAGDRVLPELFLRGLRAGAPELAAAAAAVYWSGEDAAALKAALGMADRVVAYGSDETVRAIRDQLPVHVPLVAYHHRSGVAVVGREALVAAKILQTAEDLARAASTFDQRGCVSPHRVWVLGDREEAVALAEATAAAMAREAEVAPPGERSAAERARIQQVRAEVEMRAAGGAAVRAWSGAGTGWTVILQEPGPLGVAGAPRVLVLTWAASPAEVVEALREDRAHLQSVGLAGLGPREDEVVDRLAELGATRLVPLADMPFPPAWWIHDGEGPLRALVRWAEWTQ